MAFVQSLYSLYLAILLQWNSKQVVLFHFFGKDLQVELLEIISMTAKLEKNSTLEAMESLDSWPKEIEASTSNG